MLLVGGGFKYFFGIFTPNIWGRSSPILTFAYFSDGVEVETTNQNQIPLKTILSFGELIGSLGKIDIYCIQGGPRTDRYKWSYKRPL